MTDVLEARHFPGWTVPDGYRPSSVGACRSCSAEILWTTTPAGKRSPLDRDGRSHFATCPQSDAWRTKRPARSSGRHGRLAGSGPLVLEDGPAAGRYTVTRSPYFLRAVVDAGGRIDILDQLTDAPRQDERVFVYEAIPGTISSFGAPGVIVCPPPAASGRYRHRADVDGEQLRETEAWRAWCRAEPAGQYLVDAITGDAHGPLRDDALGHPAAEPSVVATDSGEAPVTASAPVLGDEAPA